MLARRFCPTARRRPLARCRGALGGIRRFRLLQIAANGSSAMWGILAVTLSIGVFALWHLVSIPPAQGWGEDPWPSGEKPAQATVASPQLFFSDLESGPNTGGQDNLGAFVTIWGEGFGATRGTSRVTIGGQEVARYVTWSEDNAIARSMDMIVVQPGPNVTSGNIIVTVNGNSSNPLPFTVRDGQIFFVISGASNASDSGPGTFEQPFKTIYRPRQVLQAGDIVYITGGAFSEIDPASPGWDAILVLDADTAANGTADRPVAYIGYPGERPVFANPAARRGILLQTSGPAREYYVLANLTFTQSSSPLPVTGIGHRLVGNYLHEGAFDDTGTIGINGNTSQVKILGNLLRNNGTPGVKLHHGVYIGGFGINQDIEVGWNQIQGQHGGRAIQLFGHVDGDRMENIRLHDNLVSGSELNNIVLGGTDGSTEVLGAVNVYNNIIVGSGDPGLRIDDPQGTVIIQNNVLYNNGSPGFNGNAQVYIQRAGAGRITFQNNILYAGSGQTYYLFEPGVDASAFNAANNNLVYNAGACPTLGAGCINADPLFAGIASMDFHLQTQSPAINAGLNSGIARDYMGLARPQGGAYDIGAHEFAAGGALPGPIATATPAPAASPSPAAGMTPRSYLPLTVRSSSVVAGEGASAVASYMDSTSDK